MKETISTVFFEANLFKKSRVKLAKVSIKVAVKGEIVPENFERFVTGKTVGAGWIVLSAKYISHKQIPAA